MGDVRVKTRCGLTVLIWKDRWEVYMLTNMDPPPAVGNFCGNSNRPVKPRIVERYIWHMGCVSSSDRMAKSSSMIQCTFKWTTKLFFHLLDLTVLNSWILLSSYGAIYTHWDFKLLLVRNLIEEDGKRQDRPTPRLVGRPSGATTSVVQLESCHNQHCPAKSSTKRHFRLCSFRGQRKGTVYKYARCYMGLCMVPRFVEYHTRVNL